MPINVGAIANQIVGAAAGKGGSTWAKIQASAPYYIKGYAQTLAEIARGVAKGEISLKAGKLYAANAKMLLTMGIANTAQIVLHAVQTFINDVLRIVKGAVNAALGTTLLA